MNNNLIFLAEFLNERLTQDLPGHDAHIQMASPNREGRESVKPKPNARQAAVAIILNEYNDQIIMPIIERPKYEGVHGGQMAFPGGKVEDSDQSLLHTAMRETEEEIGITLSEDQYIGKLSPIYIPPSNFLVHPFLFTNYSALDYTPDPREVEKVVEFPLIELLNDDNKHLTRMHLASGMTFNTPAYHWDKKIIWGATAMIFSELELLILENKKASRGNSTHGSPDKT